MMGYFYSPYVSNIMPKITDGIDERFLNIPPYDDPYPYGVSTIPNTTKKIKYKNFILLKELENEK